MCSLVLRLAREVIDHGRNGLKRCPTRDTYIMTVYIYRCVVMRGSYLVGWRHDVDGFQVRKGLPVLLQRFNNCGCGHDITMTSSQTYITTGIMYIQLCIVRE